MNENEQLILELLKNNPYLSQQEIAQQLGLSRPTVANLISGLMKQGYITGRAYVLAEQKKVICIGGANVDRKYRIKGTAQQATSNPTTLSVSVGGVARNIAENLGRLQHSVQLLTVAGQDADWEYIRKQSAPFMDVSAVQLLTNQSTGSYAAVLDDKGEMLIAMATMDVYEQLTPTLLHQFERQLATAALLVVDLNCPKTSVSFIRQLAMRHGIPLAIIPVSSPKMVNLPDSLTGVTWLICNEDEAETITKQLITTDEQWRQAVQQILDLGVTHVAVTRGIKGVMVGDAKSGHITHYAAIESVMVADVTGAGDALNAGILHGFLSDWTIEQSIYAGLVNAAQTVQSTYTVRPELSKEQLKLELEDYQS